MKVLPVNAPFGNTIFCDDVRQEMNGKLMLIGVYPADIVLYAPLPATIHLSFVIKYYERRGEGGGPVAIKVFMPGNDDPAMQMELDTNALRSVSMPGAMDPADDQLVSSLTVFHSMPVTIEREGFIKVRAYLQNDEVVRLGALTVRAAIIPQQSAT